MSFGTNSDLIGSFKLWLLGKLITRVILSTSLELSSVSLILSGLLELLIFLRDYIKQVC